MERKRYKYLGYNERKTIEDMGKRGSRVTDISAALSVHRDTIYKELKRCNATLETYNAEQAQKTSWSKE